MKLADVAEVYAALESDPLAGHALSLQVLEHATRNVVEH